MATVKPKSLIDREMKEKEDKEVMEVISQGNLLSVDCKLADFMTEKVLKYINQHRNRVYVGLGAGQTSFFDPFTETESSIFTGDGGLAFMNFHLFRMVSHYQDYELLNDAMRLLERPLRFVTMERITFLGGDAGLVSLAAVVYHYAGRHAESRALLEKLCASVQDVCNDEALCNDLIYGRSGYLFCLLFVRKHIGLHNKPISDDVVLKVLMRIVKDGKDAAEREERGKMLMFRYHNRSYLGAREGICGILHTLLQVDLPDATELLYQYLPGTMEYLLLMKLESGNRPIDEYQLRDTMTAWCHGSAGWVHTLVKAYEFLGDRRYLEAAMEAEEIVWNRGYHLMLNDRHSLCHGMAGNGYCHLALYRVTKDMKYLQRACKIGHKCFQFKGERNYQKHRLSLMDGLSGTVCFLSDLLDPTKAAFPGYEV